MKKFILFTALLTLPITAQAADNQALCTFLPVQEHFTGANYVPGVDVNGKPVVSADIKAQAGNSVDVIKVPVDIDIVQNLGLGTVIPEGTEMMANFGMIEVHKDSRVVYNGEDISAQAYEYCGKEPFNIEETSIEGLPEQKPVVQPKAEVQPQTLDPETKPGVVEGEDDIIWIQ